MKLRALILSLTLIICSTISAQQVEVFGAYSYGSAIGSLPSFSLPFHSAFNAPTYSASREGGRNAMTLGVNVRILGNFSLGLSWTGLNKGSERFSLLNSSFFYSYKQSSNSVIVNVKYDWLKINKFNLYSRAGLGIIFFGAPEGNYNEDSLVWKDNMPQACKRLAWQVSFVGIDYRPTKWVGIFAEGGLGRQGALLAGLKVYI